MTSLMTGLSKIKEDEATEFSLASELSGAQRHSKGSSAEDRALFAKPAPQTQFQLNIMTYIHAI